MNSWKDIPARQQAVRDYVKHLLKPGNEKIRAQATDPTQRDFAKKLFAEKGRFEIESSTDDENKIPRAMEFRVYEQKDIKTRDEDLGVMVLPKKLVGEPNVSQVWRCTWDDWTTFQGKDSQKKSNPARVRSKKPRQQIKKSH